MFQIYSSKNNLTLLWPMHKKKRAVFLPPLVTSKLEIYASVIARSVA
jgi:hypothetical protein